jgi:hypothetical protein
MSKLQQAYSVRERVAPFVKGLFKGEPLAEVAREGLKRECLPPQLREKYEKRIEINDIKTVDAFKFQCHKARNLYISSYLTAMSIGPILYATDGAVKAILAGITALAALKLFRLACKTDRETTEGKGAHLIGHYFNTNKPFRSEPGYDGDETYQYLVVGKAMGLFLAGGVAFLTPLILKEITKSPDLFRLEVIIPSALVLFSTPTSILMGCGTPTAPVSYLGPHNS